MQARLIEVGQVTDASPCAVILTALPLEYEAVRAHLTGLEVLVHSSGARLERGALPGTPWLVALTEIGEGAYDAASSTERVISAWLQPQALLFVGVAGSLKKDVRLGDIVIATKVYAYHGGKETPEGFYARPQAWVVSHRLEQAARFALRGQPGVHFKPIAAGDVVLNAAGPALADQLNRRYNDAVAVEKEGTGVAHAAHLTGALDILTIRGISDTADGDKDSTDPQRSLSRAAARAAEAAIAVLRELEPHVRPSDAGPSASDPGYGGDYIDFRGSTFYGPVTGKVVRNHQDD